MLRRGGLHRLSMLGAWVLGAAGVLVFGGAPCQAGDIWSDIVARCPSSPRSFEQVLTYLETLRGTGRVGLASIGVTHQGRPIPLVVVAQPAAAVSETKKLFIIARQHGNEPSGTTAALALAEHFAVSQGVFEQEILKRLTFIIVPVANPDGAAAGRRANSKGVDLNRDWSARTQPETRAIAAAVEAWQPDAILDLHELPAATRRPAYQENFLETAGRSPLLQAGLCAATSTISRSFASWMHYYGYPCNVFYDYPGKSLALCHRYFGLALGYPAFLCEAKNGPAMTLARKAGVHILAALVIGNYLINSQGTTPLLAAQQAPSPPTEQAPAVKQQEVTVPPAPPPQPRVAVQALPPGETSAEAHRVQIEARVLDADNFSYLTVDINGRMRTLTNRSVHRIVIDTSTLGDGTHTVVVAAHSAGGGVIAQQTCELTIERGRLLVAK